MSNKALAAIDALTAWISRTPNATEVEAATLQHQIEMGKARNSLMAIVDGPDFLDACCMLAQIGMSADDLKRIVHAMADNRILAFGYGEITDLGQRGAPHGRKPSRLTEPYNEGDQL